MSDLDLPAAEADDVNDTRSAGLEPPEEETLLNENNVQRRRRLLVLLFILLVILLALCGLIIRYLIQPEPIPDMLPGPVDLNYPPRYVYSIYDVDRPVSVAYSAQAGRLYVAEMDGERLIKIFDRNGRQIDSFAPPYTSPPERSPVYLAVTSSGRVFVSDRAQHAIFVYDLDGNYLDTILSPTLTLSEYLSKHIGGIQTGTTFAYNLYQPVVNYLQPGEETESLPAPDYYDWAPLGIRIDQRDRLIVTDVAEGQNVVRIFPQSMVSSGDWSEFEPHQLVFGEYGEGNDQFIFPNSAVVDSRGRIYVTDSNNSRISVWDEQGDYLFNFGRGTGEGSVNLPRGAMIDDHDRLYIVDAVAQSVNVYDVSGINVEFLYSFGGFGVDDGNFNYPNDIAIDPTGRVYVVDRENNRVQVWAY